MSCLLLSSCGGSKRLSYLQDMDTLTTYDATEDKDLRISKNDKLNITVTCKSPELAAPFNIVSGSVKVNATTGEISGNGSSDDRGYMVDKNGNIDFPVLGQLHVYNMTREEVKDLIEHELIARNYIKDPIVLVDFVDFQVTVLGEINSKGIYKSTNNRMTILEAIAQAGDLPTSAVIDDIWVIRTENGKRNVYSINLKTKDCFDSPAYYLKQNDIVYVKPKKAKLGTGSQLALTITSTVLSGLSALASIFYWTGVARK